MPQNGDISGFFEIATDRAVVIRAGRIALVVGVVLAMINHVDKFVTGTADLAVVFKVLLTFAVPYCVSTYSSVQAVQERQRTDAARM